MIVIQTVLQNKKVLLVQNIQPTILALMKLRLIDAENVNNNHINENDTSLTDLRERANHRRKSAQTSRMMGVAYEGLKRNRNTNKWKYVQKKSKLYSG